MAAIHYHRRQSENGSLDPISEFARQSDELIKHTIQLIKDLNPTFYFIENPRGALRKMDFMQGLPRFTVTYCKYGDTRMKPSDIFSNMPDPQFIPACKNGDPCHEAAPRGAQTGTQGIKGSKLRSVIPHALCTHIANRCTEEIEKLQ